MIVGSWTKLDTTPFGAFGGQGFERSDAGASSQTDQVRAHPFGIMP
jgi:hypothetical protein